VVDVSRRWENISAGAISKEGAGIFWNASPARARARCGGQFTANHGWPASSRSDRLGTSLCRQEPPAEVTSRDDYALKAGEDGDESS